jgi:hypothetical protein
VLAFAATAGRPAAVLTGPAAIAGPPRRVSHLLKVSTPRGGPLTVTGHGAGCERAGEARRGGSRT